MQHYFVVALLLFLAIPTALIAENDTSTNTDTVIITSDNWCPYTCLDTDEEKGLIVEVVAAAFDIVGKSVRYIYRTSWARAIQNVQYGHADALLGADKENNGVVNLADSFFIYDETVFAVNKGSNIVIEEGKDLSNYSIGVLEGYGYDDGGPWEDYIEQHANSIKISVSNGAAHLLQLVVRNRIKIAIVNWDVAKLAIKSDQRLKNVQLIRKGVLSKLNVGFAKSARGDELLKLFNTGFNELVGTSKLQNIYDKYNIEMPTFVKY